MGWLFSRSPRMSSWGGGGVHGWASQAGMGAFRCGPNFFFVLRVGRRMLGVAQSPSLNMRPPTARPSLSFMSDIRAPWHFAAFYSTLGVHKCRTLAVALLRAGPGSCLFASTYPHLTTSCMRCADPSFQAEPRSAGSQLPPLTALLTTVAFSWSLDSHCLPHILLIPPMPPFQTRKSLLLCLRCAPFPRFPSYQVK